MDEKEKKKITDEINGIIESRHDSINKFYFSIRNIYKEHYGWPEMDPLRNEICICIMFGLKWTPMSRPFIDKNKV